MNNQSSKDLAKEFSEFCIKEAKRVKPKRERISLIKAVLPAVFVTLLGMEKGGFWDAAT
jgi:hypothetical protein